MIGLLAFIAVIQAQAHYDRLGPCEQYRWDNLSDRQALSKCRSLAMGLANRDDALLSDYYLQLAVRQLDGTDQVIQETAISSTDDLPNVSAIDLDDDSYGAMANATD